MSGRELAQIKAGGRADIEATRTELMAWLDQPLDLEVRRVAGALAGDLGAALIGARVHPVVKANLIEGVANLERARAHGGRSQGC